MEEQEGIYLKNNNWKHLTIFTSSLDAKTQRDPNHRHRPNEGRENDEAVKKEDASEDLRGGKSCPIEWFC